MQQNALKIYKLINGSVDGLLLKSEARTLVNEFDDENDCVVEFCDDNKVLIMFHRLGLIKSTKCCNVNNDLIKDILAVIEKNVKDSLPRILDTFHCFCYGNKDFDIAAICGDVPQCEKCNASLLCPYWNKRPTLKQLPAEERPREKLIRGGDELLSDSELLGIIIRDGTPKASAVDIAKDLLVKYGDFRTLGTKTIAELCKVKGIGEAKAAQIKAAIAIAKRYSTITITPGSMLNSSNAIFQHFHETLRDKKQETFVTVLLDNKNRVLKEQHISTGSLTASIVHPREVFAPAIKEHAASVVFVHNHPSGDPTPSNEDVEITERLKEVSFIVGIKILDHIVIGDERYISFKDEGLL